MYIKFVNVTKYVSQKYTFIAIRYVLPIKLQTVYF